MTNYGDKNALERLFTSYGDHPKCLLERLRDYLDTVPVERSCAPTCSKRMSQTLQKIMKEMITSSELVGIKILLDLIIYLSDFPSNGRGLDQLISYNTLPVLLSDVCRFLIGSNKDCNQVIADLIMTVMSLCEFSDKLANSLHLLIPSLLNVAVNNSRYSFAVRIDCVRVLNALLEACDNQYKISIKSTLIKYNLKLAVLLPAAGDYELQVAIVECLFRTTTAAERVSQAQQWFSHHQVAKSFIAIREVDFEKDCRNFLNVLNHYMNQFHKATVYSLPCQEVVLGDVKLSAPQDMQQLWMDFNTVSRSMSVFVSDPSQQEDVWESVTIKRTNICDYKITAIPRGHLLLVTVSCPLTSLTSFPCSAKGNNLQALFTANPSHVLQKLLEGVSKSSVALTPVQLGSGKKLSSKLQNGPQQASSNIQTPEKAEDVTVSPIDPLGTPVVNSSTGSICTPPDQSIPVKTPQTSTPSLKSISKNINKSCGSAVTSNKGSSSKRGLTLSTKKVATGQPKRLGQKTNIQTGRTLSDQTNTKSPGDQVIRKPITAHKKASLPVEVTANNIDSFLNQLSSKPKPIIKKYSTRSSVKALQESNDKQTNKPRISGRQENHTSSKQTDSVVVKSIAAQNSYKPTSPVVRLQHNKRGRPAEAPSLLAQGLSAFDFTDDVQSVNKKSRQIDSSVTSSCNSSAEMSRLNASLLARGNTSKSFSMTPQKKTKNSKKKKLPVSKKAQPQKSNINSSKVNSMEVCVVLESQDVHPMSPPLDGQFTTGTTSVARSSPTNTTISSYYSPKSDSTYEPSANTIPSRDTPAVVTPSTRGSPESAALIGPVTPPTITPTTTPPPSPVVESANASLEYSQPSTPEEDHMITKGFQEVCQELLAGAASGRGSSKKVDKRQVDAFEEHAHEPKRDTPQKENVNKIKKNQPSNMSDSVTAAKQNRKSRHGLKPNDVGCNVKAPAHISREQRNKRRRQSTGEMEATPVISPPAKKPSIVRQLDLRVIKTPVNKTGPKFEDTDNVDLNANDNLTNLDHVTPSTTPFGSPTNSHPIQDDIGEVLGNFGDKINQAMKNKRNHYDQVLQEASKTSSQLLNSVWSEQYQRRRELLQGYHKKTMEELYSLEEDIKATQQAEEQAVDSFKHHQKSLTEALTTQKQKLTKLRATAADFHNEMESLENSHTRQQGGIHQRLRKEMRNLQDKILNTNKQQELRMVKQSLQAMLLKL